MTELLVVQLAPNKRLRVRLDNAYSFGLMLLGEKLVDIFKSMLVDPSAAMYTRSFIVKSCKLEQPLLPVHGETVLYVQLEFFDDSQAYRLWDGIGSEFSNSQFVAEKLIDTPAVITPTSEHSGLLSRFVSLFTNK